MGQEMINFSAPQGPRPKTLQRALWGRKRSFFPPYRDRPQDITTSIKSSISASPSFLVSMPPSCLVVPCGAGNDHVFCPVGSAPQDITTIIKHCNLQCFLLLPRTKQRYLRCFLFREPQNRVKTLVFSMFSQQPKTQVLPKHRYLRHFGNTTCPKCCILQCFWNTFSKTLVFTAFCRKHPRK